MYDDIRSASPSAPSTCEVTRLAGLGLLLGLLAAALSLRWFSRLP